jgi:hypothetical protein
MPTPGTVLASIYLRHKRLSSGFRITSGPRYSSSLQPPYFSPDGPIIGGMQGGIGAQSGWGLGAESLGKPREMARQQCDGLR